MVELATYLAVNQVMEVRSLPEAMKEGTGMKREEVERVASFCRIELGEKEKERLEEEMESILEWAEELEELKLKEEVGEEAEGSLREDKGREKDYHLILEEFPKSKDRKLKVPKNL